VLFKLKVFSLEWQNLDLRMKLRIICFCEAGSLSKNNAKYGKLLCVMENQRHRNECRIQKMNVSKLSLSHGFA